SVMVTASPLFTLHFAVSYSVWEISRLTGRDGTDKLNFPCSSVKVAGVPSLTFTVALARGWFLSSTTFPEMCWVCAIARCIATIDTNAINKIGFHFIIRRLILLHTLLQVFGNP